MNQNQRTIASYVHNEHEIHKQYRYPFVDFEYGLVGFGYHKTMPGYSYGPLPEYVQISENAYLVDGDMNIYDFLELVDYPDKEFETEYTTVGGWCTEILERFPEVGDVIDWHYLHLEIVQAEQMRVEKVRVTVNQPQDEENELEN